MNKRTATVTGLIVVGATAGPAALNALDVGQFAIGWLSYLLAFVACAFGTPVLLASAVGTGNFKTMVQLWSVLGALSILLVSSGASSVALSFGSSAVSPVSVFAVVVGAGLLSGLGIVKLLIHKGRDRNAA